MNSLLKIKSVFVLLVVILCGCDPVSTKGNERDNDPTTTYYLVRHAEKDRVNPEDKNPNLTSEGFARAENWNQILKNVKLDLIYTTNYNRTQQTAQPIANQHNLTPIIYDANNFVTDEFLKTTKGKTVFIVGHSNTLPQIANALIGDDMFQEINDNQNGNLYIITKINDRVIHQLLVIN